MNFFSLLVICCINACLSIPSMPLADREHALTGANGHPSNGVAQLAREASWPHSSQVSGHADDLGGAEDREVVHQSDAGPDFGRVAVRVSCISTEFRQRELLKPLKSRGLPSSGKTVQYLGSHRVARRLFALIIRLRGKNRRLNDRLSAGSEARRGTAVALSSSAAQTGILRELPAVRATRPIV